MGAVGSIEVDFIARTASFDANIAKSAKNLEAQTAQMNRSLDQVQRRLDGFSGAGEAFFGAETAKALFELSARSLEYAASLGETSQQLGVTSKDLQEYRYVASQVGLSQEDMDKGLQKLTVSLGQARLGALAPKAAFGALSKVIGVDIVANSKTAGDAVVLIAKAFEKVKDATQRAAVERALFGRAGQQFDPLLAEGAARVEELRKAAEDLGLVLSDRVTNQARDATDKIKELKAVLNANIATAVGENAKSIVELATALEKLTLATIKFINSHPQVALATIGALIGGRVGGLPGAGLGVIAGIVAGDRAQKNAADTNTDPAYRAAQLRAAEQELAARQAAAAGNAQGTTVLGLTFRHSDATHSGVTIASAQAEVQRQRNLLAAAAKAANTPQPKTGAGTDLDPFLDTRRDAAARRAAELARQAAALDANARAALAVSQAYLQSAAAGAEAEARRVALTDATKKGIDVDARVRRQLAIAIGDTAAAGAKSVSQLREETAARTAVDLAVENGTLGVGQMSQALSDEAALRDLTTKRVLAQKLGLTQYYDQLTAVIEAYQRALADAHAEEAHGQALQSLEGIRRRLEDAQLAARYAGDNSGAFDVARARLDAAREAADRNYSPADAARVSDAAAGAARANVDAERARYAADLVRSQQDATRLAAAELGSVAANDNARERILAHVTAENDLLAHGVDLNSQAAQKILLGADAVLVMQQRVRLLEAGWQELKGFGEGFIDNVLNPQNWTNWRDVAISALQDIAQELLKLSLINPLKNLAFGENLPTSSSLGGIGGILSSLFGGGGGNPFAGNEADVLASLTASNTAGFANIFDSIGHFAGGGDPPVGMPSLVGEQGAELFVPKVAGTIIPTGMTGRLMAIAAGRDRSGSGPAQWPAPSIHFHGPVDERQARLSGRQAAAAYQREMARVTRAGTA